MALRSAVVAALAALLLLPGAGTLLAQTTGGRRGPAGPAAAQGAHGMPRPGAAPSLPASNGLPDASPARLPDAVPGLVPAAGPAAASAEEGAPLATSAPADVLPALDAAPEAAPVMGLGRAATSPAPESAAERPVRARVRAVRAGLSRRAAAWLRRGDERLPSGRGDTALVPARFFLHRRGFSRLEIWDRERVAPPAPPGEPRASRAPTRTEDEPFWTRFFPDWLLKRWAVRAEDVADLVRRTARWRTRAQLDLLAAKPWAAGNAFEFSVIGDAEPGRFWWSRRLFGVPGVFERQLKRIQGENVDFSMQLGDMVSRGLPSNYAGFFRQLDRVAPTKPYLSVLGNHDRHRPHGVSHARLYRRLFGEPDYAFDHAGVRFVVLDTSAGRLLRSQLVWLGAMLDVPGPKIVFTHMAPGTLGAWTDFGGARGVAGFRQGAKEFAELVSRRRVQRVYVGHVHGIATVNHLGVRYVLSGGGGSPLYPMGQKLDRIHHYLTVLIENGRIEETVHTDGGSSYLLE